MLKIDLKNIGAMVGKGKNRFVVHLFAVVQLELNGHTTVSIHVY